jgi:hypothetical protein
MSKGLREIAGILKPLEIHLISQGRIVAANAAQSQVEGELVMRSQPEMSRGLGFVTRATGALALALCLVAGAHAQQGQQGQSQGQDQAQPQQPQPPQQPTQDSQSKPTYASQDADKPPYSRDKRSQNPPMTQPQSAQNPPEGQYQPAPASLTIPAGTILSIRVNEYLSSDHSQIGDPFTAVLERPIVVNGWVVARRGQTLVGKVKVVQKAGRIKGVSQLGVELTDLTIVDGRQLPILTELSQGSGGTSRGQDVATVGTATGVGALIGSAADWGRGAAIGAGAGAAAGIGAVLLTRGRPAILEPETPLSFRLVDPVTIDTTVGQQAFMPVTQEDFDGARGERRGPRRYAAGYPGYPRYYYPYYAYPPYVGFYGSWGPRYYGGFYGGRRFRY